MIEFFLGAYVCGIMWSFLAIYAAEITVPGTVTEGVVILSLRIVFWPLTLLAVVGPWIGAWIHGSNR